MSTSPFWAEGPRQLKAALERSGDPAPRTLGDWWSGLVSAMRRLTTRRREVHESRPTGEPALGRELPRDESCCEESPGVGSHSTQSQRTESSGPERYDTYRPNPQDLDRSLF